MKNKKSKSLILDNIISEVDEQLGLIPSHDFDGSPIEDSLHMDMYVDSIAEIHFTDGLGRKHYPFDKTIATYLVEDELECRLNKPTEEDKNVDKENN
jgi:ubiquinone biosynthesis protein COQ9|tara:strand:- start:185 stop:475 length:291 start_codon:yes stop_codon:yes gene_type:complete